MKFIILLLVQLAAISLTIGNDEQEIEIEVEIENEGDNKQTSKQWAVLVAGSDGWWNYRHQADVCHAYQILIKRGIPASNIIVFMKDDIANNYQNPKKGVIINRPNGTDVYKGVKIDYKGKDVTPKNFINVLLGNKSALKGVGTGRVLGSGSKDNVFINFSDHGGTGILCFPEDDLSAKDLLDTLKKMSAKKKYGKLLMYIEACEAGSMFDGLLPENTKILGSTASAYDESSWGCYCDYLEYPCLGDLYSVNWMEHLDTQIPNKENLFNQYQLIRKLTSKSHPNLYGDYRVGSSTSDNFVGPHNFEPAEEELVQRNVVDVNKYEMVPSRDIPLHWLKRQANGDQNSLNRLKYSEQVSQIEKNRVLIDKIIDSIIGKVSYGFNIIKEDIENGHKKLYEDMLTCYEDLYHHFSEACVNMFENPYVVKHFYKFSNICQMDIDFQDRAHSAIDTLCGSNQPKLMGTL